MSGTVPTTWYPLSYLTLITRNEIGVIFRRFFPNHVSAPLLHLMNEDFWIRGLFSFFFFNGKMVIFLPSFQETFMVC